MRASIYQIGGPTHLRWAKDMSAINEVMDKLIADNDALVTDPEDGWVGFDPAKLPADIVETHSKLRQLGYWHGWIAA